MPTTRPDRTPTVRGTPKDFPDEPLAERGVQVASPDEYLTGLITQLPGELTATVIRLAAEKRRPPMTPYDLADHLKRSGVPVFAAKLRALLDEEAVGVSTSR